jgi:hypothetical protein
MIGFLDRKLELLVRFIPFVYLAIEQIIEHKFIQTTYQIVEGVASTFFKLMIIKNKSI